MNRVLWRLTLALVLLAAVETAWADDRPQPPPYFPSAHKKYSGTVHGWTLRLFGGLVIGDDRIEDIVHYLEGLPGSLKVAKLELRGNPRPTPREVHEYYLGWAAENGFRLLFECRTPERRKGDDPNRTVFAESELGYTDAFHLPGPTGGLLLVQAKGNDMLWMWQPGHVPVGPIASIWMGLPRVKPDMTPPEGPLPWRQRPDLPPVDAGRLYVRLEFDRWELDSLASDLHARAKPQSEDKDVEPLLKALYTAGPEMVSTVEHAWYLSFRAMPGERAEVVTPWVRWARGLGWTLVAEGHLGESDFRMWLKGGAGGGLLLVLEQETQVHLTVFDGGPDLESVGRALARTETGEAEAP